MTPAECPCWACGAGAPADAEHRALRHCRRCGLRFAPDRSQAELQALYGQQYYDQYAGGVGYEDEPRRRYEAARRLAFLRRFLAGDSLLEVGSASGWFLDEAQRAGLSAVGIEPSVSMAERARRRFDVEIRVGFLETVDLPVGQFDAACLWHVLEHIPEPAGALGRVARLLRPHGIVALEVPNAAGVQAARHGQAWPHWDWPHHVAHYTPDAVRELLTRHGWTVVSIDTLPGTAYHPLRSVLTPLGIALAARDALALRALPRRPHPDKHELIRAVARRPDDG